MRTFLAALALFLAGICSAAAAGFVGENPTLLIGHGRYGRHHWFVAATQDENRKGICLETGAFLRSPRNGVDGGGQCSAPAVKRGILQAVFVPGARPRSVSMTAVGGAFNVAVKLVEVTSFHGTTEKLTPKAVSARRASGSTVAHFRYLAFAVRGPWCAARIVTLDRNGHPLWETDWEEIDGFAGRNDVRSCPGFPRRAS